MAWTNDLHLSINGFSCINIAAMAETPNTVVGKPHDGKGSPGGCEPPNAWIRTPCDGEGSPLHQETPNTVVGKPHDGAKCPTPGLGHP